MAWLKIPAVVMYLSFRDKNTVLSVRRVHFFFRKLSPPNQLRRSSATSSRVRLFPMTYSKILIFLKLDPMPLNEDKQILQAATVDGQCVLFQKG